MIESLIAALRKVSVCETRKWLKRNEVFFTTIVAICLTMMSIMVSIMSIQLAEKANEVAFYEVELLKAEQQPIIHFELDKKNTNDKIIIYNKGSNLKEFKANPMIFLSITYNENKKCKKCEESILFPLKEYYFFKYPANDLTGKLMEMNGNDDNYGQVYEANNKFINFAQKHNDSGNIKIKRYIQVKYKDIFENPHEAVYRIEEKYYNPLTEADGGKIIYKYGELESQSLTITDLSPDILYQKWSKNRIENNNNANL